MPVDVRFGLATSTKTGKPPAHFTIQCIGTPPRSEARPLVQLARAGMLVREPALLAPHELRHACPVDRDRRDSPPT